METQCYFNGEFYQAVADTQPGESPKTAPAKWARIPIPKEWRNALKRLAYAGLLELDGQGDKSARQESAGMSLVEDMAREEAQLEGWRERPNVRNG